MQNSSFLKRKSCYKSHTKTKFTICNPQTLKFDFLGELWNLHVDKNRAIFSFQTFFETTSFEQTHKKRQGKRKMHFIFAKKNLFPHLFDECIVLCEKHFSRIITLLIVNTLLCLSVLKRYFAS